MIQALYTFIAYPLLILILKFLSLFDKKIAEGFSSRQNQPWMRGPPPNEAPWIWFHVASGEFEYAKPVIRELKKKISCRILVTYFSPSVLNSLKSTPEIDFFTPTPWDTPWHWNKFIHKYKPQALAIARTDLWPNMIFQCFKCKVPTLLFSATLPSHSGRVASFWGRFFYGFLTEHLSQISCVTLEDKENFLKTSSSLNITVDGDTRFDQVLYQLENSKNNPVFLKLKSVLDPNKKIFIAGSTWPQDEDVLIPSLKEALKKNIQILIAPHEPTAPHIHHLKNLLLRHGLENLLLSEILNDSPYVPQKTLIIDQVGILAGLYALANLAFIGGSFKKSVHSVMEASGAGCLVLVGPMHFNNREALLLKKQGYVLEVNSSSDFEKRFSKLTEISNEEAHQQSLEIRKFVLSQSGASSTIAAKIVHLSK